MAKTTVVNRIDTIYIDTENPDRISKHNGK